MAMLAVSLCVNFSSCSKEESISTPQYELAPGKRLTQIELTLSNHDSDYRETWDFEYDSEGKLIESTYTDENGNIRQYKYTWNNNSIEVYEKFAYRNESINDQEYVSGANYNLKNGLIQKSELKYNEDGHPVKDGSATFMWDEDALSRVTSESYTTENTKVVFGIQMYYSANTASCNGYNPYIPLNYSPISGSFITIAHPEIAGMRSNKIPNRYLDWDPLHGGTTQGTYSHRLDNDGYIAEFRIKENSSYIEEVYTMTWK